MARSPKPWFYRQTGWWMCWLNGKKEKLAKGRKNKRAAVERLLELRLEASRHRQPDDHDQTVASVIEIYQGFAVKRLAASTLEMRRPYLQSFAETHGWRLVSRCKPHHMEAWLHDHPEWVSDWTKNSAIGSVQVVFNWAARSRLIAENPFRGVTHPVGCARRDITDKEFQAIMRATASKGRKKITPAARFRQMMIFLRFTGCRPKEASILEWLHIDFDNCLIVFPLHKTIRTQRRPRVRIIPLDPVVVKLLRSIQQRGEGDRVFLTHRLTPWNRNTLGHRLRRARQAAGVADDAKLYGERHAFGTRAVVNGCDLKTLSALMGHTTTRMSEHYCHLAGQRKHLADAMRRVNARRPGA